MLARLIQRSALVLLLAGGLAGCTGTSQQPSGAHTSASQASPAASWGSETEKVPEVQEVSKDPGASPGVLKTGAPLALKPEPAATEGKPYQPVGSVTITIPNRFGGIEEGPDRSSTRYFESAESFGLLGVRFEQAGDTLEANVMAEWTEYRQNGAKVSELVQVRWPGAKKAYAWTTREEWDATVFKAKSPKKLKVEGAFITMTTEGGQYVHVAAYAPQGKLANSPALAGLRSLTIKE